MKTIQTWLVQVVLAVVWMVPAVRATSLAFPKFGTPIVTEKQLVFAGPHSQTNRIICITRDKGEKLWELATTNAALWPCFVFDGELVMTHGPAILACNLERGTNRLLYKTDYDRCELATQELPIVSIQGAKNNVDYLSFVNLRRGQKLWECAKIKRTVVDGTGVILCEEGERKPVAGGGYTYVNQRLTALSASDGNVLWHYPWSKECFFVGGVAFGDYFVVAMAGSIHCINQKTGKLVKQAVVQKSPYASISLATRDEQVLLWTQAGEDVFSGHIVNALSIPELTLTKKAATDWYSASTETYGDMVIGMTIGRIDAYNIKTGQKVWQGGQWNWEGIHNGWIYYGTMEPNETHCSINMIEATTGRKKKLYEESLPQELRPLKRPKVE